MKKEIKTYCKNPLLSKDLEKMNVSKSPFEVVVYDDKSDEIVKELIDAVSCIKCMGDDESRSFWVETIGRYSKKEWYEISVGHVVYARNKEELKNEFRWVSLYDGNNEMFNLGSSTDIYTKSENVLTWRKHDYSEVLQKILDYITKIIEKEKETPGSYNEYVSKNLPYSKRNGKIKRSEYNELIPSGAIKFNDEILEMLRVKSIEDESSKDKEHGENVYDKMTMRDYIKYYAIAYKGAQKCRTANEPAIEDFGKEVKDLTDEEIFKLSPKGYTIFNEGSFEYTNIDFDSVVDFEEWEHENSAFHCFDICYARVHLFPNKYNDGKWSLYMSMHEMPYLCEYISACYELYKNGVKFEMGYAKKLLEIHNEEDYVGIKRSMGWSYISNDEIGNDVRLPYVSKDEFGVTRKTYNKLVKAIEWEDLPSVELVSTNP